jgi:hypothetical protein
VCRDSWAAVCKCATASERHKFSSPEMRRLERIRTSPPRWLVARSRSRGTHPFDAFHHDRTIHLRACTQHHPLQQFARRVVSTASSHAFQRYLIRVGISAFSQVSVLRALICQRSSGPCRACYAQSWWWMTKGAKLKTTSCPLPLP